LVLTDREIQAALDCGHIKIVPAPSVDAYSSTSVDLTLSKFIRSWKDAPIAGVEQIICPSAEGYNFNDVLKNLSEAKELNAEGYTIKPQEFVLGWTEETIELPTSSRIAARVEGKVRWQDWASESTSLLRPSMQVFPVRFNWKYATTAL